MGASDSFAEFLREQLAPLGRVSMRRMFGKAGLFCDGVMFGIVSDNTLYFRVDDHNREIFGEAASLPPLTYEKRGRTIDLRRSSYPYAASIAVPWAARYPLEGWRQARWRVKSAG